MAKYIGYCPSCRALSEFSLSRLCPRSRGEIGRSICNERIQLLDSHNPVAEAVMAAYKIGGWGAAVDIWVAEGRPALGSPWTR